VAWSGALSVLGLLGLAYCEVVINHSQVGITEAGTGLAAVITAAGAVRVARERFKQ
jgi:hypothetical protein